MAFVSAENLCLDYPLVGLGSQSLKNRVLGAATGGLISGGDKVATVSALRDVSFAIREGDRLGLIGHNGAGKSTLLKVLAGIYLPTSGKLTIDGKIVSTLNLSIGMEAEATGYENIITRGLLLGMPKKEILQKLDEIAEFTELGEYLNLPVRIYSSGMATRLAFAVVTAMHADILLMDEVIGTGDASFIEKAENRLNQFMRRSEILVLASHSDSVIRKFCNKAMLFEHGKVVALGEVDDILTIYNNNVSAGLINA